MHGSLLVTSRHLFNVTWKLTWNSTTHVNVTHQHSIVLAISIKEKLIDWSKFEDGEAYKFNQTKTPKSINRQFKPKVLVH